MTTARVIGLKVDVDTLRGTQQGVPRLLEILMRHRIAATFYFSVGPDHTGRALRRVFRPGFARKVVRTSVVKHYGLRTLMYGVLLPGPDIARRGAEPMRRVHDAGFEVGLHTFDHVRWQDKVASADAAWTRREFERGVEAFERVFGFPPRSHAAAGWQINEHALALERDHGMAFASDTRGTTPFLPELATGVSPCLQLPTTLPTFDELLGSDGVDESNVAEAVFEHSRRADRPPLEIFTLHAELEGMRLAGAFESLLTKWRDAGLEFASLSRIGEIARAGAPGTAPVVMAALPGRSGLLATQGLAAVVRAR